MDINMYFAGKTPIKDFVENQDLIITLVDIAGGFQPVARPGFGMSKGGGELSLIHIYRNSPDAWR